uniref:uncharacterized protein LOC114680589 n=1 Tax=Macaca mulatta TaxID=9544 RepID=UPI0010A23337|nr:uncharacterized protein LOC114680589 [Macaca mulatta]
MVKGVEVIPQVLNNGYLGRLGGKCRGAEVPPGPPLPPEARSPRPSPGPLFLAQFGAWSWFGRGPSTGPERRSRVRASGCVGRCSLSLPLPSPPFHFSATCAAAGAAGDCTEKVVSAWMTASERDEKRPLVSQQRPGACLRSQASKNVPGRPCGVRRQERSPGHARFPDTAIPRTSPSAL